MLYYFNRLLTFIIIFGGMDMEPQKKLLMIVNPRAGRSKPRGPLYDAAAALCDAGYLLRIRRTTAAGDAARIAAQEGGDYDTVVAVGGDGTLNEVISGIQTLKTPPVVGYLPQGSTNDFAASLEIPSDPVQAAEAIVRGQRRQLDIGRFGERIFVYVASFGAFTRTSYTASQDVKNALAREATSDIPIVGTSVTDYVFSGLVASNEAPGANVTGASDMNPVNVQVQLMKTLCPEVKTVGIVINSGEENSAIQAEEAKTAFEAEGFAVKIYSVADTNEIQTVVTAACNEVDAFYEPTDNLIAANVPTMSNITTAAGKPVICGEGGMCESGFLATYAISYYELGRAAGEQAFNILVNGADPATTPIFFFDVSQLTLVVNEQNAAELGITIPEELK